VRGDFGGEGPRFPRPCFHRPGGGKFLGNPRGRRVKIYLGAKTTITVVGGPPRGRVFPGGDGGAGGGEKGGSCGGGPPGTSGKPGFPKGGSSGGPPAGGAPSKGGNFHRKNNFHIRTGGVSHCRFFPAPVIRAFFYQLVSQGGNNTKGGGKPFYGIVGSLFWARRGGQQIVTRGRKNKNEGGWLKSRGSVGPGGGLLFLGARR